LQQFFDNNIVILEYLIQTSSRLSFNKVKLRFCVKSPSTCHITRQASINAPASVRYPIEHLSKQPLYGTFKYMTLQGGGGCSNRQSAVTWRRGIWL